MVVTRRVYLLVGMWASRGAPSRGARAASRRRGVMASRASTFASTGEDWRAFASGTAAGALSALALQPLDVLKTRVQLSSATVAPSAVTLGRELLASEGLSGLYRGFLPRWGQASIFSSCVVILYEYLKQVCRK